MKVPMHAYLEAKYDLDERSLNPEVRTIFLESLQGKSHLHCLDLGTGCGAAVRRLIAASPAADLSITGIDWDPTLLEHARVKTTETLSRCGFQTATGTSQIRGERDQRKIRVEYHAASMASWEASDSNPEFDLVLAHAVMDLAPVATMVSRIRRWLAPSGLLYTTVNYDGHTTLFPPYQDPELEERILSVYDQSMENRRVSGERSGGARSGQRLFAALTAGGFEVIAFGSSDWNITPVRRRYRNRDPVCLTALLGMILDEAEASAAFLPSDLNHWFQDRRDRVESGRLGLIIHQIDILAEKRSDPGV